MAVRVVLALSAGVNTLMAVDGTHLYSGDEEGGVKVWLHRLLTRASGDVPPLALPSATLTRPFDTFDLRQVWDTRTNSAVHYFHDNEVRHRLRWRH